MAILGTLLKKGIKLHQTIRQEKNTPFELQRRELQNLLSFAVNTHFGGVYEFDRILKFFLNSNSDEFYKSFKKTVPVHDYNKMFNGWWHRAKEGEKHVCWPGRVRYFALSSGTSEASSKYIPVTKEMVKAIRKSSVRQVMTLSKYDLPDRVFEKGILMLGGSTHLNFNGTYFEGDLSGINAAQIPFWFQHFYKPGKKIAKQTDWNEKLEEIAANASKWDIGIIVGVPAWIQILLEKIIDRYKVPNIHAIWPNLSVYVHGGVSFDPYRKGFEKLLGRPVYYIETYLASEGFVAFQIKPGSSAMKLVLDNGIFYEFVPFNSDNFESDGTLVEQPKTYMIHEVEEGKDYAILLSTCAGTWRYLIGDIVRFTSIKNSEIIITGRTKHFLSLCGEHLSVDNMNKAIQMVSEDFNIEIREFTVAGIPFGTLFAHRWYVGTDAAVDTELLKKKLDEALCSINDDYRVERSAALKDIEVITLPTSVFYNWLRKKGKEGGQNKFPRVLKQTQLQEWEEHIHSGILK